MYFHPWVIYFGMGNINLSVLIQFFIDHNNTYGFVFLFI